MGISHYIKNISRKKINATTTTTAKKNDMKIKMYFDGSELLGVYIIHRIF